MTKRICELFRLKMATDIEIKKREIIEKAGLVDKRLRQAQHDFLFDLIKQESDFEKRRMKRVVDKYFPPHNLNHISEDSKISLSKEYFKRFIREWIILLFFIGCMFLCTRDVSNLTKLLTFIGGISSWGYIIYLRLEE